jgi:tyrosyl-tRNA synthetase
MSISDETMKAYYSLLFQEGLPPLHPMDAKKKLAVRIVEQFHSRAAAVQSQDEWIARFSEKRLSEADLPNFAALESDIVTAVVNAYASAFGVKKSRAEARRLIEQGSVQLDGQKIVDPKTNIALQRGQVLRLDKTRAIRVVEQESTK